LHADEEITEYNNRITILLVARQLPLVETECRTQAFHFQNEICSLPFMVDTGAPFLDED